MGDVNYHPDATNAAPYVGGVGGEYGNWGVGSMMLLINNPNNTISTVTATVPAPNRGFGGDSYSSRVMGSESSLSSGKSLSDQDLGVQEIANSSSRGGARMATEPESSCTNPSNNNNNNNTQPEVPVDALKTRIAAHPRYPQLLAAYMSCQKIGAPPEVVALLDDFTHHHRRHPAVIDIGMDPELDHFMEAFCQLLEEFHNELSKPYGEAIEFLNRMETQLNSLNLGGTNFCVNSGSWEEREMEGGGFSSEEDLSREEGGEGQGGDSNAAQDKELKEQLLKKYIGYFGSLKQEFLKKKKKGKLPKEARQKLLDWWDAHYSWPYPSEGDKVSLAECTGLDQKQINNWFINQRKRHWKPSEDMQFFW